MGKKILSTVAVTLATLMGGAATQAADLIPTEQFFRNPRLAGLQLSPDGKHIAMRAPSTATDGRMTLAVASVENPQKLTVVAHFKDADVRSFFWINNSRLGFSAIDFQTELGNQFGGGLYAVNIDSSEFMQLVARRRGDQEVKNMALRPLRANHVLFSTIRDGSDDIIVQRYNLRSSDTETPDSTLVRLNTKTKAQKDLVGFDVPEGAMEWVVDAKPNPQPRMVATYKESNAKLLVRDADGKWKEVSSFDPFVGGVGEMAPAFVDAQDNYYVLAIQNNEARTTAVYKLNKSTLKPEAEPLISLKGFDFSGQPILDRDSGKLVGISHLTDAWGVAWLDASMKEAQAKVDQLLPGTNNILSCQKCLNGKHLLVTSYSDRQSPVFFLFDREAQKLQLIGASMPWLDSRQMAERDFVRIKARDGLEIPVHVTRPKGKGPWPTVMLVHGGPNVRGGEWGWQRDSQFLASRGYLVVEPEFRGSRGFGYSHFQKGWKQWGLTMQDDVTDAAQWAVAQGLADSKRLAIAGASYGGYATMMGLVKDPDLYRAGVNWVGVTDIELMYDVGWSDFAGGDWQKFGMPRLVGDPVKDKAQLDATSPLKNAHRITKPVLMAYGGEDYRVPLPHGTKMRDALKKAGKVEVEWIEYEDEGHGWLLEKHNVDFWNRVEAFLAKHVR